MAAESAAGAGPRLYPNIDTAASITDITFRFDKKKRAERKNQTQTYTLKIEIGYLARWKLGDKINRHRIRQHYYTTDKQREFVIYMKLIRLCVCASGNFQNSTRTTAFVHQLFNNSLKRKNQHKESTSNNERLLIFLERLVNIFRATERERFE